MQGTKLYVGDLSPTTTDASLRDLFKTAGKVKTSEVRISPLTGESLEYGFVNMASEADARKARSLLDNQVLDGSTIRVHPADHRLREAAAERRYGGRARH